MLSGQIENLRKAILDLEMKLNKVWKSEQLGEKAQREMQEMSEQMYVSCSSFRHQPEIAKGAEAKSRVQMAVDIVKWPPETLVK